MSVAESVARHDYQGVRYSLTLAWECFTIASFAAVGVLIWLVIFLTFACLATTRFIGWNLGQKISGHILGKLKEQGN